jgi:hypothetical protein
MTCKFKKYVMPQLFTEDEENIYGKNLTRSFRKNVTNLHTRLSQTFNIYKNKTKLHGLSPQANYTDRLSDRRLSAKLVPTLADRGCRVVSTIPPQSLISVF